MQIAHREQRRRCRLGSTRATLKERTVQAKRTPVVAFMLHSAVKVIEDIVRLYAVEAIRVFHVAVRLIKYLPSATEV
jgi:hypothetical protein